jgi:hypothetical protein
MSSPELKKLARQILKDRDKYKEGGKKDLRKDYQELPGQIVIIRKEVFFNTVKSSISILRNSTSDQAKNCLEAIWGEFKTACEAHEARVLSGTTKVPKSKATRLFKITKPQIKIRARVRAEDIIIVASSFDSFQSGIVNKKQKKIVKQKLDDFFPKTASQEEINTLAGADNKSGAQLGHGAGIGMPTSGLRALMATKKGLEAKGLSQADITSIQEVQDIYNNDIKMFLEHSQVFTKAGGFSKDYTAVLEWQATSENQKDKNDEVKAITNFFNKWQDLATAKSSTSLVDALPQVILAGIAGKRRKNKRVVGKRADVIKERAKVTDKTTDKIKDKISVVNTSGVSKSIKSLDLKSKKGTNSRSMFSLIALLNERLPDTVRKNMGPPNLTNTTGRFANSVKVTDISRTPKGYPSIGYTYKKDPYQVFEVGSGIAPWANTQRDPRKLIDASIRELAANLAIGRFYTRRQ